MFLEENRKFCFLVGGGGGRAIVESVKKIYISPLVGCMFFGTA